MLPILRHLENMNPCNTHLRLSNLDRFFDDFRPSANRNFGNLDLYEDEQNVYLEVDLPGINRENIELTLEDGVLHLHAHRKFDHEKKDTGYFVRERAEGQWSRSVRLPEQVQSDKIDAAFRDGVLKITLEKQEQSKPRKIEIK